ncbi:MAG TPA: YbaK/EbsC family protein [Acidimicrobiia bacterium]|nr:YbaK/EbsC family protein [Acidimicrobiia bacterium]
MELPDASKRLMASMPERAMQVRVFPEGTKTAEDAAAAIGCSVAAIVKSLVFVVKDAGGHEEPVVALVPGDLRLDPAALAATAGAVESRRASLEEVRQATGFSAGGTPPFGHLNPLRVFADPALRRHDPVWAAAGTPTTVFPISLAELDQLARPVWAEIVTRDP